MVTRGAADWRWGTLKSCSCYTLKGYHFDWCWWNETETICSFADWNVRWTWVRDAFCLRGGEGHLIHGKPCQRTASRLGQMAPCHLILRNKGREVRERDKRLIIKRRLITAVNLIISPLPESHQYWKATKKTISWDIQDFQDGQNLPSKNTQRKLGKT